ncbi:isochorismate synthase [Natronolimnohabitans innermongolicus]|uniref:isochorismate synthase n=1 Tax=Natronolimnohabitans innermongolicus JCM 12255 TaxID=1227499 RepID=L9XKJ0_9EURY|nr:isochorismate synthase [Natronolimnohabitans innermongolicus]ELY62260.1 isochorismate synthase [Natronolimnohabitans innermongolicus JCM 12255]
MDRSSGEQRLTETAGSPTDGTTGLVSDSRELEDVSFGAIVDGADGSRVLWTTPDGLEVVGCGVAARATASGGDRFDRIRAQTDETFAELDHDGPHIARPRAFGGVSFHDGHEPAEPWTGFDAASFVVPRVLVVRSDEGTWLTAVGETAEATADRLDRWTDRIADLPSMQPSGTTPGIAATHRPTSREDWADQVETALGRIDRGDLTKVVLAQSLSVDLEEPIDVPGILERLRRRYPNCYRFLIGRETGGTFFGAPPERLVSKRGNSVETEALAGSVPRGETPEKDDAYADEMRDSEKVQHEHGLVGEAITDQLEPLAAELTVEEQTVKRLANIQHLRTPISATLEDDRHVLELVEALHPTPAVGGVAPAAAWETIRDVETFDRGWYAAPVGWFDGDGDGEFAVGLRSGVATDQRVTLFAGNGIVADSDPDDEWDEVQLKFRPILDELD